MDGQKACDLLQSASVVKSLHKNALLLRNVAYGTSLKKKLGKMISHGPEGPELTFPKSRFHFFLDLAQPKSKEVGV